MYFSSMSTLLQFPMIINQIRDTKQQFQIALTNPLHNRNDNNTIMYVLKRSTKKNRTL